MEGRVPWRPVRRPEPVNGDLQQVLATVDALHGAWAETIQQAPPAEFAEARRRSLTRHAIETGIIERLYDVDWGVTKALVAEGLTADVAAREGGLDDDALGIIQSQYEALEFLAAEADRNRDLSISLIRQLHTAICRSQRTYLAHNALGQEFQAQLRHGDWKKQPNHVLRPDGTLLEYTPPEHVQAELDRLVEYYQSAAPELHPLTLAAWLHHAFITIHPFEDGNGRVARALTMLVLLRAHYAPLVVNRESRTAYIEALDRANAGDLRDLVRLFARLEIVALRSELERPAKAAVAGEGAVEIARTYAQRLRALREGGVKQKADGAAGLAGALQRRVVVYLSALGRDIQGQFTAVDPAASFEVHQATPPEPRAQWWRSQIVRAAQRANFFANLGAGTWWTDLVIQVLGQMLRYVVVVQKVGPGETGVLALTIFAETLPTLKNDPNFAVNEALRLTETDTVTFIYTDRVEDRWDEVADLLDRTVAAALAYFASGLD